MLKLKEKCNSCFLICFIFCALSSCSEDNDPQLDYSIPSTYNFENVSFTGQTERLSMLSEMKTYMASSQTGNALEAERLSAMFSNDATLANWAGTYSDSKVIKSKTIETEIQGFEDLFNELAALSAIESEGGPGLDGIVSNGDKSYLIGSDGLDHAQIIEKGLMGAFIYYQATSVYLAHGKMDVDNITVTDGEGTEMEHHWDEAFGYLGVPKNFPTETAPLSFWGSYSDKRDAILNSNTHIMNAFCKGRAAISNKDLPARDEAIAEIRKQWELISITTAIHYLNASFENYDDYAIRAHSLSEAIAFIYSLKFNESRSVDINRINQWLENLAGSSDFSEMNIVDITETTINNVKDSIADIFELTNIANEL